ncbi:MAG: hypothetical protein JWN04_5242 [Myxococcaceae bacterium]|nr:hypothetical protein [Myxococcaceae bacterium]
MTEEHQPPWSFERALGSFGACSLRLDPTCTISFFSEELPCAAGRTVLRVVYAADRSEDMRLLDDPLTLRCEQGGVGSLDDDRRALLLCPEACGRIARDASRVSLSVCPEAECAFGFRERLNGAFVDTCIAS